MDGVSIDTITVADDGRCWAGLGFRVSAERCQLGSVVLDFAGAGQAQGITSWSLRGLASADLDGLPTDASAQPVRNVAELHPNGVSSIDHLVAISTDLDRSVSQLQAAGLDLRRIRELPTPAGAPRQAFFRLGQEILEVIQQPQEIVQAQGASRGLRFWGLALAVSDLEKTVAGLGEKVGPIKPAVQPERRIATLRRQAGLSLPIALIDAKT
ncbi:MAG: VOC family protein [Solirubrobacteraceae bacterium]